MRQKLLQPCEAACSEHSRAAHKGCPASWASHLSQTGLVVCVGSSRGKSKRAWEEEIVERERAVIAGKAAQDVVEEEKPNPKEFPIPKVTLVLLLVE